MQSLKPRLRPLYSFFCQHWCLSETRRWLEFNTRFQAQNLVLCSVFSFSPKNDGRTHDLWRTNHHVLCMRIQCVKHWSHSILFALKLLLGNCEKIVCRRRSKANYGENPVPYERTTIFCCSCSCGRAQIQQHTHTIHVIGCNLFVGNNNTGHWGDDVNWKETHQILVASMAKGMARRIETTDFTLHACDSIKHNRTKCMHFFPFWPSYELGFSTSI